MANTYRILPLFILHEYRNLLGLQSKWKQKKQPAFYGFYSWIIQNCWT